MVLFHREMTWFNERGIIFSTKLFLSGAGILPMNAQEMPLEVVDPTALNQDMVQWVHDAVPTHFGEKMRLSILLQKLLHESGIDLRYETNATATAVEVFESGKANCLSFTFLLVGLANEIGIPLDFVRDRSFGFL